MRLKTYREHDLATALDRARRELGPRALVLATRDSTGALGLPVVEVTVGVDSAGGTDRSATPPTPRAEPRAVDRLAEALVASGISADLARRFARIGESLPRGGTSGKTLARAAERGAAELFGFAPHAWSARRLFVVGPPGAGKTTTAAKLAARRACCTPGAVQLAAADVDRVGALEQAQVFCRHIGARLTPVEREADLVAAIDRAGPRGTVIVDTPGVGANDGRRLEQLLGLRAACPDAEVAVLVPSGVHAVEADAILDRFACLEPTCVAVSRTDDGRRVGEPVSAAVRAGLPLGLFTTGHRVPDDVEPANPRTLTALLLRAGAARPQEEIGR